MINLETFKKMEKKPRESKGVDFTTSLSQKDADAINKFVDSTGLNKSQAIRYFTILGMQTHKKRNTMKKRYETLIEEDMIRDEIIEEFHRRLEMGLE